MALRRYLCKRSDVPRVDVKAFHVQGVTWPVLVTEVEGEIVATQGVCPHEDVSLSDATVVDAKLFCPAHGYRFDLLTGKCAHRADLQLRRYKVTLLDDEVWVDLL